MSSDINGIGYGAGHEWVRGWTNPDPWSSDDKFTEYRCKNCKRGFAHRYDVTPNIFEAIKQAGIPDACTAVKLDPERDCDFEGY